MKRKIIAVIAGILIFGWAYWLVPYSPIPDTVNITEMRVYQLDRGEYADDFTERVIQIPYANCLRIFGHAVYRVCGLRGYRKTVLSLR